jgi:poly(3-hydroxybutyrate) depolymerase
MFARFIGTYGPAVLVALAALFVPRQASAQIDCSAMFCAAADQTLIYGYSMFTDENFAPIFDAFNRRRRFFVHIPDDYDTLQMGQLVPLVFAFHGGGQAPEAMIDGKWGDYFDDEIAFVIPRGAPDPCDNLMGGGLDQWLSPGPGKGRSPGNVSCDPATATPFVDGNGDPIIYWNASLPGTFTDVLFVEELRSMILARFPNLNANKVYATGFSSGGGMTLALACYRSSLFRGFSIVARMLAGDGARGDFDNDGIVETDSNSFVATCGKSVFDAGHATGIAFPHIWGYGTRLVVVQRDFPLDVSLVPTRVAKPVALFAGDQNNPVADINATGDEIRARNNLTGGFFVQNPFLDTAADDATTQRRTFTTVANAAQASAAFRRFLVQGIARHSATHAMPDAQECPPAGWNIDDTFMTCDYDYTDQTLIFFQEHADLNLNP